MGDEADVERGGPYEGSDRREESSDDWKKNRRVLKTSAALTDGDLRWLSRGTSQNICDFVAAELDRRGEKVIGTTEGAPAPAALGVKPQTPTQTFVAEELQRLLGPGSSYRTGALFLSYAPSAEERQEGDSNTRTAYGVVNGAALREPSFDCAQDLVHLIAALRYTANDLEAQLTGKTLPKTG